MCELLKRLEKNKKILVVDKLFAQCRYHKKTQERYGLNNNFNGFRCVELLHAIYPKILALMYDGIFSDEELIVKCTNADNPITVRLTTKQIKSIFIRTINKIKEYLWIIRPMDIVKVAVFAEVVSASESCYAGYCKGDKLELCHSGTICPQALYSAFTSVLLSDENMNCQCPSSINKVTYRVSKE